MELNIIKFVDTAVSAFTEIFGHAPKVYPVIISDGARLL